MSTVAVTSPRSRAAPLRLGHVVGVGGDLRGDHSTGGDRGDHQDHDQRSRRGDLAAVAFGVDSDGCSRSRAAAHQAVSRLIWSCSMAAPFGFRDGRTVGIGGSWCGQGGEGRVADEDEEAGEHEHHRQDHGFGAGLCLGSRARRGRAAGCRLALADKRSRTCAPSPASVIDACSSASSPTPSRSPSSPSSCHGGSRRAWAADSAVRR